MTVTDLTRIDRTIEINASPDRVWKALTNSADIGAWFHVTIEGEIARGNDLWMTTTSPSGCGDGGQRFPVRIAEMIEPSRLSWQWYPGAVDSNIDYSKEPRTTVTFTLEASKTGTKLTISETGFDEISLARRAKVFGDNSQGWSEVIVWIQNYAEAAR